MRELGARATRRGVIGGAIAAGVARALPDAAAAQPELPPCTPKPPGVRTTGVAVAPGRRTVWTTDNAARTITAHHGHALARGRSIDVGGAPLCIDITRDGRYALVTTAFYDRPGLAIVDLHSGRVRRRDVGAEPESVRHREHIAWVAGGGTKGTLTRVDLETGRVHEPIALGRHPRGIAVDRHNRHALVALNGDAAVALVTLATGHVRRIPTHAFPAGVALSPDGRHALVTHSGFGDHRVTPIDVEHARAGRAVRIGREPAGVAYAASGRRAVVALHGGHALAVVDGRTGHRRRTVRHLGSPRAVAISGRHAIVADGTTGELRRVRIA